MVSTRALALTLALSLALPAAVLAPLAAQAQAAPAQAAPECAANASLDTRVQAALARTDRPDAQRAKDDSRMSETRFLLAHVKPGDHVLDLGSGGGYASMVLSAAVCDGTVDAQNPADWVSDPKELAGIQATFASRPNIHMVTSDFTKVPVPVQKYDVIFIGTIYHDTFNEADHDAVAMDKALGRLLKHGGVIVLTDHKTVDGAGSSATNTLHRIDKATVLANFKAAGFKVVEDSDVLANPADDHTLKVFDPSIRGKTDRMALVFKKRW